ncbi:hypothetical protein V2S66_30930 [Streptomyces sp. V4-01]|uniref:Uncharacterized protein n=1 Tax=Actinacidiphila polyblastidii TaxID=3110430 RepID=A0ABU7PM83_9ACTN|nr:hypothetical protein [Streptomyces sp. V4-01]
MLAVVVGEDEPDTGGLSAADPGRPATAGTRGPAMVEKLFGDLVVTMSGMKRRQAPGAFATAATTAPLSALGLPETRRPAGTAGASSASRENTA